MHASACLAPRRRYSGRAFNASDICAGRSGAGAVSWAHCDQPLGPHPVQPLARDGVRLPVSAAQESTVAAGGQHPATATAGLRPARRLVHPNSRFQFTAATGSHSFCARAGCQRLDPQRGSMVESTTGAAIRAGCSRPFPSVNLPGGGCDLPGGGCDKRTAVLFLDPACRKTGFQAFGFLSGPAVQFCENGPKSSANQPIRVRHTSAHRLLLTLRRLKRLGTPTGAQPV